MKVWLSHAQLTDVCEKNITILNLMLGTIFSDIHAIKLFYKITLSKNGANHCKTAGGNNPFFSKLYNNLFIHDDMLLSHRFLVFIITVVA